MESNTSLVFGDFDEKERRLYFSDESVKSSAIEFPEDVLAFVDGPDEHVVLSIEGYGSSFRQDEERNDGVSENTSDCVNASTPDEIGTDLNQENLDETALKDSNQVSDNCEVDIDEHVSVNNLPADVSPENEERQTQEKESLKFNLKENSVVDEKNTSSVTDQKVAETSPEIVNNVITVSTKTMSTTTTKTVGSNNFPVNSSWADLFKPKSSSKQQNPIPLPLSQQPIPELPDALPGKDQFQHYFMDVLTKAELTNKVPPLQPRGLKNNGNWCYINATLQVLLFCPSFYHFLMKFKLKVDRGPSSTPILDALVFFVSQFNKTLPRQQAPKSYDGSKQDVIMGMPFEPTYVYNLLTRVKTTLSRQGKQEDAEEFLSCILNGLHEEMVTLSETREKPIVADVVNNHSGTQCDAKESAGEWEQVGPRNKSTVTRKSTMAKSPVAEIFGGYLRSSLVQPGVKESASIQPFFSIQLDLRGEVSTVQQAFDNFFSVEEVEGFQCDKSKMEVEVSKKWTLDSLPVVLILHLKRFVVNKNVCEKLTKKISYESELRIPQHTLSKVINIKNKSRLTYKLFAITYHHGKNLHGGHYTSDINHPAIGWLRADDMNVRTIPTKFVFNPLSNRDPYLLYYKRGDIFT